MTFQQFIPAKVTIPTQQSFTPVRGGLLQRKCICGKSGFTGDCKECNSRSLSSRTNGLGIQRQLTVSRPGDEFEHEADRMAESVVSGNPLVVGKTRLLPVVQRQPEDEKKNQASGPIPDDVQKPREQPTKFPAQDEPKHGQEKEDEDKKKLGTGGLKVATEVAKLLWDSFSNSVEGKRILAANANDWKPLIEFFEDFSKTLGGKFALGAAAAVGTAGLAAAAWSSKEKTTGGAPGTTPSTGGPMAGAPKDEKFLALELNWDFVTPPTGLTLKTPWLDSPKIPLDAQPQTAVPLAPPPVLFKTVPLVPRICTPADPNGDRGEADARSAFTYLWLLHNREMAEKRFQEILEQSKLHAPQRFAPSAVQPMFKVEAGSDAIPNPRAVEAGLRSPSQPLDSSTREFMESRFGHDFSQVRVHTDAKGAESARAVNALAYTVGHNVVFASEQYRPETTSGRQLIAHELTHVVQQYGAQYQPSVQRLTLDRPDSALETEARRNAEAIISRNSVSESGPLLHTNAGSGVPILSRASPDAVGHTMGLGRAAQTGIQFFPTTVTDTQVGPVTVQAGLLSGGASRLNIIIGENLTMRALARQLLPLWITATPFTPAGAVAPLPLDIITVDELAQGLMVYNQTYLPVPAMTNWRSALRFPLPVEIDESTGIATLHPLQIRGMAGAFDPAWAPLLDLRAPATVAPAAATLSADVTAFLGLETTALARGIHLGARALTNSVVELPFIQEVFRQLGPASFDVAIAFMENIVEREVRLLGAQREGTSILAEIAVALASNPQPLTAAQQAISDRVDLAIVVAPQLAPPTAARTRADKSITVDTVKLDGSTHNPATDVAMANAIFSQCNVQVRHGVNATANNAQTTGWLGGDTDLRASSGCGILSAEERSLFQGASAAFGFSARFRAFFPGTFSGFNASGYSCNPSSSPTPLLRNTAVVQNNADTDSLAHELGHILIDLGPHTATGLMSPRPASPAWRLDEISNPHCTRLYNHA